MGLNYNSLYKTDSTSVRYRKLLYKEDTNVYGEKMESMMNTLIGKIDKTKDLYYEEYDEFKKNRGIEDE